MSNALRHLGGGQQVRPTTAAEEIVDFPGGRICASSASTYAPTRCCRAQFCALQDALATQQGMPASGRLSKSPSNGQLTMSAQNLPSCEPCGGVRIARGKLGRASVESSGLRLLSAIRRR
jgi:hypothetical protein